MPRVIQEAIILSVEKINLWCCQNISTPEHLAQSGKKKQGLVTSVWVSVPLARFFFADPVLFRVKNGIHNNATHSGSLEYCRTCSLRFFPSCFLSCQVVSRRAVVQQCRQVSAPNSRAKNCNCWDCHPCHTRNRKKTRQALHQSFAPQWTSHFPLCNWQCHLCEDLVWRMATKTDNWQFARLNGQTAAKSYQLSFLAGTFSIHLVC